jgi:hypothetical protein
MPRLGRVVGKPGRVVVRQVDESLLVSAPDMPHGRGSAAAGNVCAVHQLSNSSRSSYVLHTQCSTLSRKM